MAAVFERDGWFLVTRRQAGVHLQGYWEFPGGKVHDGETHEQSLRREITEELATDIRVGRTVLEVRHDYPDKSVELHFYTCELIGDPAPMLGQDMRWVNREELAGLRFPPADEELIALLSRAP